MRASDSILLIVIRTTLVKYQCQHCEYKATQRGHLKTHVQSILERKTIDCKYCDYKATQKTHLRIHFQSQHKNER